MERLVRIKEEPKNLRALSALANPVDAVKKTTSTDSLVVDGFATVSGLDPSPFSLRRQLFQPDPFIDIGDAEPLADMSKPWWDDSLIEQLPTTDAPQQPLRADIELALRSLARDKSFLIINWRDDFN